MKATLKDTAESLQIWLAWRLPKRLVYWCAIRVMAFAALRLPTKEAGALTPADCLEAWSQGGGQ